LARLEINIFPPAFQNFSQQLPIASLLFRFSFFLVHFHTSQLDAKVGKINPPESTPPKKDPVRHFEDVNGKNCLWSRLQVLGKRF